MGVVGLGGHTFYCEEKEAGVTGVWEASGREGRDVEIPQGDGSRRVERTGHGFSLAYPPAPDKKNYTRLVLFVKNLM